MRRALILVGLALGLASGCGTDEAPSSSSTDAGLDAASLDVAPDATSTAQRDGSLGPPDEGDADGGVPDPGDLGDTDQGGPDASDASELDAATADGSEVKQPVIFIHGIGGNASEFDVMKDRLVAEGWQRDELFAIQFPDPRWGCNVDNAEIIRAEVERVRDLTGASKIDLVAHSMGTLSSRYYMKHLGGADEVGTFVTLGGLHHGNRSACLNPLPVCVWQELCPTNPYLTDLNADPAAPGPAIWVSICSRSDTSAPLETCHFDPAENIELDGVDHAGPNGLLENIVVYPDLLRVLAYP